MSERKVLNKYYPPNFVPSELGRKRRNPNNQIKVRFMLPISIRCKTCGDYINKGTKFNCRKEDIIGEKYLGMIQIFRFYFRCRKCLAELIMKTDPKTSSYVVESGATRNYVDEEVGKEERYEDGLKCLEKRSLVSKREMDIVGVLDELKSMKSRHSSVSFDSMLQNLKGPRTDEQKQELEAQDEALVRSIFFGKGRRINDEFSTEIGEMSTKRRKLSQNSVDAMPTSRNSTYMFKGRSPLTVNHGKPDHEATDPAVSHNPIPYSKTDWLVSFDAPISLYRSNKNQEHGQSVISI